MKLQQLLSWVLFIVKRLRLHGSMYILGVYNLDAITWKADASLLRAGRAC